MARKSEAHETLSLLFAQEGVPSTLVMMELENRLWVNSGIRLGKQIAMSSRLNHIPMAKCSREHNKGTEEKCWKKDDQG